MDYERKQKYNRVKSNNYCLIMFTIELNNCYMDRIIEL